MIAGEVLAVLKDEVKGVEVTSIYAHSDISKARQLAYEFDIPQLYTDFDELLREDNADFIYIANANAVHYEYAMKALLADRNLIIEKPLCATYAEAEEIVRIARERNLLLIEAVSFLHMPNMRCLEQHLQEIGKVHLVECDYSQYSSRYDRYLRGDIAPVFNPQLAGGVLRDLNVYNINFVVALFGMPAKVEYVCNKGHNGIDTSGVLLMRYPGFVCSCSAAKDSYGRPYARINGERGYVEVDGLVTALQSFKVVARKDADSKDMVTKEYTQNFFKHRLAHEFDTIRTLFENDNREAFARYQDISLMVMKIIDDALSQC